MAIRTNLILLGLLIAYSSFAQDIITTKDKKIINGTIKSANATHIFYDSLSSYRRKPDSVSRDMVDYFKKDHFFNAKLGEFRTEGFDRIRVGLFLGKSWRFQKLPNYGDLEGEEIEIADNLQSGEFLDFKFQFYFNERFGIGYYNSKLKRVHNQNGFLEYDDLSVKTRISETANLGTISFRSYSKRGKNALIWTNGFGRLRYNEKVDFSANTLFRNLDRSDPGQFNTNQFGFINDPIRADLGGLGRPEYLEDYIEEYAEGNFRSTTTDIYSKSFAFYTAIEVDVRIVKHVYLNFNMSVLLSSFQSYDSDNFIAPVSLDEDNKVKLHRFNLGVGLTFGSGRLSKLLKA